MKKPWDIFEKNYVAVETQDDRTGKIKLRYEYCGPWFLCKNGKDALNRAKGGAALALLISIVSSLWAGLQNSQLNLSGWTNVPYGLSLAALIFTAVGVVYLLAAKEKMKRPDYDRMSRLLSFAPLAQAVLLLLTLLAGILLFLIGQAGAGDLTPLLGWALASAGAAFVYFVFRVLRFKEEKNTEFEYAKDFPNPSSQTEE